MKLKEKIIAIFLKNVTDVDHNLTYKTPFHINKYENHRGHSACSKINNNNKNSLKSTVLRGLYIEELNKNNARSPHCYQNLIHKLVDDQVRIKIYITSAEIKAVHQTVTHEISPSNTSY